jgi:ectoine hydroxylase-related dioxygenase (phytanoyl-CoA dioxygenase family)
MSSLARSNQSDGWLRADDCNLEDFIAIVEQPTTLADYPHATTVDRGVLIYDSTTLGATAHQAAQRRTVEAELAHALLHGPGVFVIRAAFPDTTIVDRVTAVFSGIINEQRASGAVAGDHFAKPGANDRIWNALEKLALRDADAFAEYYANDMLALASHAWLGPGYQITSQVNQVNPGGAAQVAHTDYHLGFMTNDLAEQYPAHVHALSPALTLQGAVAHCDMPVESGPTLYLPHSQKYPLGYLAWRLSEFRDYFDTNHVQLALAKGDAVFFNPSLFHAAGHNRTTDVLRLGNLLQVSSAFGRSIETVNREVMVNALYPALVSLKAGGADERSLRNIIAATAEGYAFPTNLDLDQPIGGLTPESQAELTWQGLQENWPSNRFTTELAAHQQRRRS